VNGMRTTITEVTDEQGVTTKTIENSDGTKQVFVNGQPAAIGGGEPHRNIEGNRRQPIYIDDDDDQDENMYEAYSRDTREERGSARRQHFVVDDQDDDPNLFHPRIGRGQSKHREDVHLMQYHFPL